MGRRSGPGRGIGEARYAARPLDALIEAQPWDSLVPHLLQAGAAADASLASLKRYARLVIEWNRNVSNLFSRHDERRFVERHIAESVEAAAWLKSSNAMNWIDFGSGGGLPAIPLSIVGVGARWTLVESRRTKSLFLKRAVGDLGLAGISVVLSRLEDLADTEGYRRSFDGFTSRATLALMPTLALASRLVAPGGYAFLWKGSRRDEEMSRDRSWEVDWELDGLLGIGSGSTVVARFSRRPDRSS